jgi:hypothetical protein
MSAIEDDEPESEPVVWDYEHIKALATGQRPASTLIALSRNNDPFFIRPARRVMARWFEALWRKHFSDRMSIHLREIHYVLVSQKVPVKNFSTRHSAAKRAYAVLAERKRQN